MKKDILSVKILQKTLVWEDENANLIAMEEQLSASGKADLVLLPEMFATGFSMRPELYADRSGRILHWMQEMAQKTEQAICGSAMVEEGGKYFNRLYFVKPDGEFGQYDKRHLFTMGQEPGHYSAGQKRLLVTYLGWKILPLVCYDLRFPVFSRNDVGYDILLYVANWPEVRSLHWDTLLKARAIENQAYVLACNRVGLDGNGIAHRGGSAVINFRGEVITTCSGEEKALEGSLSHSELLEAREKFPVLRDADTFSSDWKEGE